MESTANAWSPNQLKLFTSMFSLHNHDLPFALTGKELWTNCTKGLLEESDIYTGFIPYDGLDQIPFEIRFGNDGRDFSDNMGFVKLDSFPTQTDSWLGTVSDRAYIYAIVGESNNGICRILDKALTESGLFNSRINLKYP